MKGIVVYTIELNGCLNGVYTNDDVNGEIFNEIARRRINSVPPVDVIDGEYDCFYFDTNNARQGWSLRITSNPLRPAARFLFSWFDENNMHVAAFNGFGYRMNDRQIAVRYTSGANPQLA